MGLVAQLTHILVLSHLLWYLVFKSAAGRVSKSGPSTDPGVRLWDNERSRWNVKARGVGCLEAM